MKEEPALSTRTSEGLESLHRRTLLIVLLGDRHLSVIDLQTEVSQQRRLDITDRLLRRHIPLREEVDLLDKSTRASHDSRRHDAPK